MNKRQAKKSKQFRQWEAKLRPLARKRARATMASWDATLTAWGLTGSEVDLNTDDELVRDIGFLVRIAACYPNGETDHALRAWFRRVTFAFDMWCYGGTPVIKRYQRR
jgi:hypothetical protein